MRAAKVFLFFCAILFTTLTAFSLDDPKTARAKYDELAAKVKGGDLNIDWKSLRLSARAGEVYGNYDPDDAAKRAQAAFAKGDFEGALKISQETERHNIADGNAHAVAFISLKQLGRDSEAANEWSILQALLQSILKSGDGKSSKKAWFVVAPREEDLLLKAIHVQFKERNSRKLDGHYYDAVLITDQFGDDILTWFNADVDAELQERAKAEGHPIY
jgi:hypothetical protein